MTSSIEQMTDRFDLLPDDAQKAIHDFDYDGALKGLHILYKLHIDQAAALEQVVADVVFGSKRPQSLMAEIEKDLRIPHELAATIAIDVNKKILMPIQEGMKKIQAKDEV